LPTGRISALKISQARRHLAIDAGASRNTEKNAQADLTAAEEQLKTLGVDKKHPSVMNVYARFGRDRRANVTQAAAAGVSLSGSATAFTIADLSRVWIVCDVYENDIPNCNLARKRR